MTEPLIVSLDSRKGGVGKTTLALAIARDALARDVSPVVFVDADLLGSEVADVAEPLASNPDAPYELGLLDLLTQ